MHSEFQSRIEQVKSHRKATIDLSGLGLTHLPQELKEVPWVKNIILSHNGLEELPEWIEEFTQLESLDLRSNKLKKLPKSLDKLSSLKSLFLRNNQLKEIPLEIRSLKNLRYLSLGHNKIEIIPSWIIEIDGANIDNNPIIDPPIEVYLKGVEALKNYFREKATGIEKLFEAKVLIVGEPGAGKTTLMNLIRNEDFYINVFQYSTKGIEINPHYFITSDRNYFRINIWDFGGQEIYHATHQFFLTKRSLYILVSDNRAEDTDFYYWLQTIDLLSDNSPLLIVQNERFDRKRDLNTEAMKERFSNIAKIYSFNLATDKKSLRNLVTDLQRQVVKLPHIGTELPKIWIDIRNALEERAETKAYISEFEYLQICDAHGMKEKDRALFLSDYLHDLGVFLHFKDNALLKRWIILKPDWGTEAVYKILDDKNVINKNGYFNKEDLTTIWNDSMYADMHDELITLMMKFELCYQLESSNTYIAAQLLQRIKPKYTWDESENLTVRYEYDFMPKGIITRFIVRMNFYIADQRLVWREGVVLERYSTRAEIVEIYGSREIRVRIKGEHKKEFLAIILDSFDRIHLTYSNLKVKKLIPCNCGKCRNSNKPNYFEYDLLKKFLSNGINTERCRESFQEVKIPPLIDDVLGISQNNSKGIVEVFISYNDEDFLFKNQLRKHLNTLTKSRAYIFTDKSNVNAGENEKAFIRDKLDTTRVILALISSDYLSSEWNYNVELSKALDRSETKSCLFIPLIIRECNWEEAPLNNIKPVLFGQQPLFSNQDKIDEALTDATTQIRKSIEQYLNNKSEEDAQKVLNNE